MIHREEETTVPAHLPDRRRRQRDRLSGAELPRRTLKHQGQRLPFQSMRVPAGQTPRGEEKGRREAHRQHRLIRRRQGRPPPEGNRREKRSGTPKPWSTTGTRATGGRHSSTTRDRGRSRTCASAGASALHCTVQPLVTVDSILYY